MPIVELPHPNEQLDFMIFDSRPLSSNLRPLAVGHEIRAERFRYNHAVEALKDRNPPQRRLPIVPRTA